jgi:predicted permease
MTRPRPATGAFVSLTLSCAAWLSLAVRFAGAPWAFVPAFLLLGFTGSAVGLAAALIERTRLALVALALSSASPTATAVYVLMQHPFE